MEKKKNTFRFGKNHTPVLLFDEVVLTAQRKIANSTRVTLQIKRQYGE